MENVKVSECECESEPVVRWLENLEKRILALEMAIMSFTHQLEQGSGHPDDGGWFD